MGNDNSERSRPLRSARWFRKDDLPGFVHRSTLAAAGWSREDLMTRPVVGILNTWSDLNPCNMNLRALAQEVRTGILEAGGIPFEAPMMSLSENIISPHPFPSATCWPWRRKNASARIPSTLWCCWVAATRHSPDC